jgi:hypothetical protein
MIFLGDQPLKPGRRFGGSTRSATRRATGGAFRFGLRDQPIERSAGQVGDFHLADEMVLLILTRFQQPDQGGADDEPLLLLTHTGGDVIECIG